MITRRRAILTVGATIATASLAQPASAEAFTYKGWRFDTGAIRDQLSLEMTTYLKAEVDIIESLAIKPEIMSFFRSVPCVIDFITPGGPGAYMPDTQQIMFSTEPQPHDNPVFLHELLHAYHQQRLPGGFRNPMMLDFWRAAVASGQFPPKSYMLGNHREFFAMCASVILWGRASRPPFERANVKTKLPKFYDWAVAEFGFTQ